jgi:hypothetical protein
MDFFRKFYATLYAAGLQALSRFFLWLGWGKEGLIPKSNQTTSICHSGRSEESRFLNRRDS